MSKSKTFSPELQRERLEILALACDEVAGMWAAGASDKQISIALSMPMNAVKQVKALIYCGEFH